MLKHHLTEASSITCLVFSIHLPSLLALPNNNNLFRLFVCTEKNREIARKAVEHLRNNPYIHLLGRHDNERLPIISFVVFHKSGRLLHYNFVCKLLNDLFGIQTRGGCVCAGIYGQHLLGISLELVRLFLKRIYSSPHWRTYTSHLYA